MLCSQAGHFEANNRVTGIVKPPKPELTVVAGVLAPHAGDVPFHAPHHSPALLRQEEAVHVCIFPSLRRRRQSPRRATRLRRRANGEPFSIRFISESPIVAKIQYWMKITFVFILILFLDSVNRVYRVQVELAIATENQNNAYVPPLCDCFFLRPHRANSPRHCVLGRLQNEAP